MPKRAAMIGGVVVSVTLFIIVWRLAGAAEIARVIREASVAWVVASVAAFIAYQWLRTVRVALLLELRASRRLFATICVQGAANDLVLPAATGDIALGYLLKRWHGISYGSGFASVLVARVADIGLFAALLVALALWQGRRSPGLLLVVAAALIILLVIALGVVWRLVKRGTTDASIKSAWRARLATFVDALAVGVRDIHSKKLYLPLAILTLGMWLAMYLSYVALLRSLGAPLGSFDVLMLYVLVFPVDLSPIKGFANVGTHEGTWYLVLRVLGVASPQAAALSVASHALVLLALLVTGAIGLSYLGVERASQRARQVSPKSL